MRQKLIRIVQICAHGRCNVCGRRWWRSYILTNRSSNAGRPNGSRSALDFGWIRAVAGCARRIRNNNSSTRGSRRPCCWCSCYHCRRRGASCRCWHRGRSSRCRCGRSRRTGCTLLLLLQHIGHNILARVRILDDQYLALPLTGRWLCLSWNLWHIHRLSRMLLALRHNTDHLSADHVLGHMRHHHLLCRTSAASVHRMVLHGLWRLLCTQQYRCTVLQRIRIWIHVGGIRPSSQTGRVRRYVGGTWRTTARYSLWGLLLGHHVRLEVMTGTCHPRIGGLLANTTATAAVRSLTTARAVRRRLRWSWM